MHRLTLAALAVAWCGLVALWCNDTDRQRGFHTSSALMVTRPSTPVVAAIGPSGTAAPTGVVADDHPPAAVATTVAPAWVDPASHGPQPPPHQPASRLPQTSGAAATLLLSGLAILTLSTAYQLAAAADRRGRYQPRHLSTRGRRPVPYRPHPQSPAGHHTAVRAFGVRSPAAVPQGTHPYRERHPAGL